MKKYLCKGEELTHWVGIDFKDANGVRVRCFQLLDERRQALAIADFDDANLTRFRSIDRVMDTAKNEWLKDCQKAVV